MKYENPEIYPSEYSDYYFTEEDFLLSMDANQSNTYTIPAVTSPPSYDTPFDDTIPF